MVYKTIVKGISWRNEFARSLISDIVIKYQLKNSAGMWECLSGFLFCMLAAEAAVNDKACIAYGYVENKKDCQHAFSNDQAGEDCWIGNSSLLQIG